MKRTGGMRRTTGRLDALPAMTEAAFQVAVIEFAGLQRWRVMHIADSRREVVSHGQRRLVGDGWTAGWPDLVLVRERIVYAELKAEAGRVSAKQEEWLGALRWAGAEVYVWKTSDWPVIERVLGPESETRAA